eukprot:3795381-Amphidinium_carterae.1
MRIGGSQSYLLFVLSASFIVCVYDEAAIIQLEEQQLELLTELKQRELNLAAQPRRLSKSVAAVCDPMNQLVLRRSLNCISQGSVQIG